MRYNLPSMTERDKSSLPRSAHQSLVEIFSKATPSVGMDGLKRGDQRFIILEDAPITINYYRTPEHRGSAEQLDHFSITVLNDNYGGVTFVLTPNGLREVTINRKRVTLRSHLHPRSHENLKISYPEVKESKTPLEVFREAAKPLADWVIKIIQQNRFEPPPVVIW